MQEKRPTLDGLEQVLERIASDDIDYFFDMCADQRIYDGHHREYTRAEITTALRRTQFRVRSAASSSRI
jgi:hypothetical protein